MFEEKKKLIDKKIYMIQSKKKEKISNLKENSFKKKLQVECNLVKIIILKFYIKIMKLFKIYNLN